MKTKRIFSLLLAVLLVLSALPMMFMTATAAGTAGERPAKLPTVDGDYFLAEVQKGFSFTGTQTGTGGTWYDTSKITLSDRTSWVDAQGFMFKFDATGITGTDAIKLGVELSVSSGNVTTYLLGDPNLAKAHGGVAADTANTSSTWYVCTDGVNWTSVTHKWSSAYATSAPLTTEHTTGYVFIPMNQFQSKTFTRPVGDTTETLDTTMLTGDKAIEKLRTYGNNLTFNGFKVRAEGAAHDANFVVSELGFVYLGVPGRQPSSLPNASGNYYIHQVQNGLTMTGNKTNVWYNQNTYLADGVTANPYKIAISDKYSWVNSEGFMFKFDGRNVAGTDAFKLAIQLAVYSTNGTSTYLVSDPNLAKAFGGVAADSANTSSTWYVCTDGTNWKPITHDWVSSYAVTAPLTLERTTGYVFIPWDQFWTKGFASDTTMLNGAQAIAAMTANGATADFREIHVRTEGAATDASFSVSELGFVYPGVLGGQPDKLPTVGGAYDNAQIMDGLSMTGPTMNKWYNEYNEDASYKITISDKSSWVNAEGFMFKFDSRDVARTDAFNIALQLAVYSTNGNNTYLVSDPNLAKAHGGVAPTGSTPASTWYICTDGTNWTPVTHTYTGAYAVTAPLTTTHTTGYVFIPWDQFWTKGFASDSTMLNGADAIAAMTADGATATFTEIHVRAEVAATDANFSVSEFGFVYLKEAELPTTLPTVGGNYTNMQIMDGLSMTGTTMNVWYNQNTYLADGVTANPYKITISDKYSWVTAEGFMFKFDSRYAAGTDPFNIAIQLAVYSTNGNNTYLVSDPNLAKAHGGVAPTGSTPASTWYISTDGVKWESVTHQYTGAYAVTAPLTTERTTGYVFIPWDQFWTKGFASDSTMLNGAQAIAAMTANGATADFREIHVRAEKAAKDASFTVSEFGFVHLVRSDSDLPVKLPVGGDAFYTASFLHNAPIYYGNNCGYDGLNVHGTENISDSDWSGVENSAGFVFKFDTSAYTGSDSLKISASVLINGSWLCSDPSMAEIRDAKLEAGDTSTWYYSTDGTTWKATTATGAFPAMISGAKGVGYFFIPWESFWYGNTTMTDANGYALNGAELFQTLAESGTKAVFNQLQIRTGGAALDASVAFSDFGIAYSVEKTTAQSSITLTEDFSYNFYVPTHSAKFVPSVTFQIGDVTVSGVAASTTNGYTKYVVADLLPQQITEKITATWTLTLENGEVLSGTSEQSILDYALKLLEDESQAEWHNVTQAMINYAAAAQKREGTGFKGVSCEEYVKTLENEITDLTTLEGANTLGFTGDYTKFIGAALRLEGTIEMKLHVSSAVSSVKYTIGDRSGTATVEVIDGASYVFIPVYAHEMALDIVVTDAANAADSLTVSVNYYLASARNTGGANTKALLKAIANYGAEAAKMK